MKSLQQTSPTALDEENLTKFLDRWDELRHPGCMFDDINIPRSPTAAAIWLVNQAKDASTEFNNDSARTERFFLASYQIIKPMFEDNDRRTLFLLTLREELDRSDFDWWNHANSMAETPT